MATPAEKDAWIANFIGMTPDQVRAERQASRASAVAKDQVAECPDRMMMAEFMAKYGAAMRACPDAYVGLEMPERPAAGEVEKDFLKWLIAVVTTAAAVAVLKNPTAAKGAASLAGGLVTGWVMRNLPGPLPAHIEWIKVREIMGTE